MGTRARAPGPVSADEPRGRVRRVPPRGARWLRRPRGEPRRMDALQLGDPRRARAVPRPCDRGAHLRRGGTRGLAAPHCPRGAPDRARDRRRHRRLPPSAQPARGADERVTRVERLAAGVAEPLLVTRLVNVRYLTGFVSSNAALLVDPAGEATLYTDFRYAEAARNVDGVMFEEAPRALIAALAERLTGRRIAVEAAHLSLAYADLLRDGGVELVPSTCSVEALRAVKEPGELELLRRAAAISDRVFGGLAREQFVGRTEKELAGWIEQAWHEAGADGASFAAVVAAAENGARPHAKPRDVPIPNDTLVVVDAGCAVDGYASDCTRTFFTGEPSGRLRELYELCLTA